MNLRGQRQLGQLPFFFECSPCLALDNVVLSLRQVAEKEGQRRELAQRCNSLEARLAPLDADKAELAGKLLGLEKRLKEADKARSDFEWRSRCAPHIKTIIMTATGGCTLPFLRNFPLNGRALEAHLVVGMWQMSSARAASQICFQYC